MSHRPDTGTGPSPEPSRSTSTGLLQRVKAQDAEAWQRLVDLYGPLVYRWCRQAGLQAEDASDMVQEVFSTVVVRVGEFRRSQGNGSFRGWLRVIARHKVGDHFVRLKNRALAEGGTTAQERLRQIVAPSAPPSTTDQSGETGLLSQRALELVRAEFEPHTWQAFLRVTAGGRSPAQVAEELGMTPQAVYTAKCRVLCRLRQQLDDPPG